jgi:hypothetical protein
MFKLSPDMDLFPDSESTNCMKWIWGAVLGRYKHNSNEVEGYNSEIIYLNFMKLCCCYICLAQAAEALETLVMNKNYEILTIGSKAM